jgi:hypothetical protein
VRACAGPSTSVAHFILLELIILTSFLGSLHYRPFLPATFPRKQQKCLKHLEMFFLLLVDV